MKFEDGFWMQYFITNARHQAQCYLFSKIEGLANRLINSDGLTVEIEPDLFSD
jgi:hypothetical protein